MNKEQAIQKVDECISSIFSKEDVKKLINEITVGVWLSDEMVVKHTIEFIGSNENLIEADFRYSDFKYEITGDQHGICVNDFTVDRYDIDVSSLTEKMEKDLLLYLENKMSEDE
jgi:hypothetical protein